MARSYRAREAGRTTRSLWRICRFLPINDLTDTHTHKVRYSEMQKQSRGVGSPGEGTLTVV
ncbi:hypothetical protein KIN20_025330 [Parelaphostrongylus tenuis]|uniref:Uncharacterized protein n=1 Tax=Parelaphostrongylus tenuis TaxID=148309 RepID=A0AAD5MV06_PARTN|nr:hypothetical protein KIN20_025330 [Parelaphostrongylus tenuis]